MSYYEWRKLRDEILRRDKFTCLRCDRRFRAKKELSVHHLIPRADGGGDNPENLVTLCNPCHDLIEIQDLRTAADIIGSLETVVLKSTEIDDDAPDPYNRPEWHRYVYGGKRR